MRNLKNQKAFAIGACILIIALCAGVASVVFLKSDDNIVEETSEAVIEHQLGLPPHSIDFTPDSNET
jgi:hypothetical protein